MTFDRRDFLWNHRQLLLVESVVPDHSLHLRDLSATGMNVTVTLSVEEAEDREATRVEEAIFYSFGSCRVLQWLDRWLINPVLNLPVAYKGNKVFRRLQAILEQPHASSILGSGQEEHEGALPSMRPPAASNMAETSSSHQAGGVGFSKHLARKQSLPA